MRGAPRATRLPGAPEHLAPLVRARSKAGPAGSECQEPTCCAGLPRQCPSGCPRRQSPLRCIAPGARGGTRRDRGERCHGATRFGRKHAARRTRTARRACVQKGVSLRTCRCAERHDHACLGGGTRVPSRDVAAIQTMNRARVDDAIAGLRPALATVLALDANHNGTVCGTAQWHPPSKARVSIFHYYLTTTLPW